MQRLYLGVLLLLGAVWGTSFLFIKIAVAELPPETLVAARLVIASLILLVVLYASGQRLPTRLRTWADLFFLGGVGLVTPYLLITWGEQHIASGMAAILNATTPLFTVLLTYLWTREEQLSGARLLGVGVGFLGVVVAVGLSDLHFTSADALSAGGVLLAACCYGVAGVYSRRAFRGVPAMIPASGQLLTGAILITPVALLRHGVSGPLPSAHVIGAVLSLAVFGTALAYVMLYWLIARIGASRATMVTYLLPPFALLYGALFLGEPITLAAVSGLGLVVVGILLANGVIRRPALRPRPAS